MSEKHLAARAEYWASVPKENRAALMREVAKKKQSKLTFAQKRAHALKMVEARRRKLMQKHGLS